MDNYLRVNLTLGRRKDFKQGGYFQAREQEF